MKITKIVLAGLSALIMIGALGIVQPANAAPFHATSIGMTSTPSNGSASWRHHHHRYHRGHGLGVNIRF
jgi:hypothetical protein